MNKAQRKILRESFNRFLLSRGLNRTERLVIPFKDQPTDLFLELSKRLEARITLR